MNILKSKRFLCVLSAFIIFLSSFLFLFNENVSADTISVNLSYYGRPFSYQNLGYNQEIVGTTDWNARVYGKCNFTFVPVFNFYSDNADFMQLALFDTNIYDPTALHYNSTFIGYSGSMYDDSTPWCYSYDRDGDCVYRVTTGTSPIIFQNYSPVRLSAWYGASSDLTQIGNFLYDDINFGEYYYYFFPSSDNVNSTYLKYSDSSTVPYKYMSVYCSGNFDEFMRCTIKVDTFDFCLFGNNLFQGNPGSFNCISFNYQAKNGNTLIIKLAVNVKYVQPYFGGNYNSLPNAIWEYNFDYWYLIDSDNYQGGYNTGYQLGYDNGLSDGTTSGYNNGYDIGLSEGSQTGYNNGYNIGYGIGKRDGIAESNDYTFLGLLGAVVDAPITALSGMLNFDLLGFNMLNFFYALITVMLIVFVIKNFLL